MTPKEKARELRDKMYLKIPAVYDPTNLPHYPIAKEMSLIAVDEIINSNPHSNPLNTQVFSTMGYWMQVKHEIELL